MVRYTCYSNPQTLHRSNGQSLARLARLARLSLSLVPRSFETLLRSGLFKDLEHFNENISAWDTSEVVDMSSMFYGAAAFNMPIGPWAEAALVRAPGQSAMYTPSS